MVTFNHEDDVATMESPQMGKRANYLKMRPPKAGRAQGSRKSRGPKHGGIRLRRSKRWSW
jgi:hypothetical protein